MRRGLTAWSLGALAAGLILGLLLHGSSAGWVQSLSASLRWVGRGWILVLQLLVVPLVLSHAALAVLRTERLGAVGLKTAAVMVTLLVLAAAATIGVSPLVLALYPVDPASAEAILRSVPVAQPGPHLSMFDWVRGYLPASVGRVFQGGNVLPVLVLTLIASLIARAVAGRRRDTLTRGVERIADLSLRVAAAVMLAAPAGILALAYGLAVGTGVNAVGFIVFFIVSVSALMTVATLALYPVAMYFGRMSLARFARGVAPAQVVALSTRSSLVSLPAMIEGARDRLQLPPAAAGFVLPFTVSTFKLSMAVSHVYMAMLTAHVFGPPLSLESVILLAATILLMSTAVPGIPGGTPGLSTLPAFVAAGVSAEGVIILDAVDAIPDVFKTVMNVTADMTTAVVVTAPGKSGAEGHAV